MNVNTRLDRIQREVQRRQGARPVRFRLCDSDGQPIDGRGAIAPDLPTFTIRPDSGDDGE